MVDRRSERGPVERSGDVQVLLEMRGITKRFSRVLALSNVHFSVRRGEIRGLLGENGAGKTTLMNIVYGLVRQDEGEIEIDGRVVDIRNPRHAIEQGIGMVHQHFKLVPTMTVAENVALGLPTRSKLYLNMAEISERISNLSQQYRLGLNPGWRAENLSVGMKQRVEILKLLFRDARLLIFDEPTAVLTPAEWASLAEVLRGLASVGRTVIFISHKLDEMLSITESCTVMRDGRLVSTVETSDTDKQSLARMMVGREIVFRVKREEIPAGEVALEVEGLSVADDLGNERVKNLSFSIREREILGVAGVDGNGQRELVEALSGIRQPNAGEIRIAKASVRGLNPHDLPHHSISVITEDRQETGAILDATLLDNLMLKRFPNRDFSRKGILLLRNAHQYCNGLILDYGIRTPDPLVLMRQLSGGNQQRAVLARELCEEPKILIAAQPTRGLDVGAMEFVYEQLFEQRRHGCAILLVSSELEEVLSLSDRIAVMTKGRFAQVVDAQDADLGDIGMLMAGEPA